jgi:glutamate--cysteine ligase catalytic subunit
MGLLALGTALEWPEAKQRAHQVRQWGIKQLLEIWNKAKGKERDALLWGDEVRGNHVGPWIWQRLPLLTPS